MKLSFRIDFFQILIQIFMILTLYFVFIRIEYRDWIPQVEDTSQEVKKSSNKSEDTKSQQTSQTPVRTTEEL